MHLPIKIDLAGNIEQPTFVLKYKSGRTIGALTDVQDLNFENSLGNASNFNFSVNKKITPYYHAIKNFRLIWVPEWDKYYEINVDINESISKIKNVTLTHLPEAELSQIMLYGIEINTENDINNDNYVSTVFYNKDEPKGSLLHRITEKAVNFIITHVDESLVELWRTFSFDNISLYDAFQEIAEELNCIFIFDSYTDKETGEIIRAISVYDLECWCKNPDCLYRKENMNDICPECENTDINHGYGDDTTIFFSLDNIAEDIGYSTDVGSVKNCFRLEGGDDLMTSAIMSVNPSGSQYIWYIDDDTMADMSDELVIKYNEYQELLTKYTESFEYSTVYSSLSMINDLIDKYQESGIGNIEKNINKDGIEEEKFVGYDKIIGYSQLTNLYYDVLDMENYLQHELMPSVEIDMKKTNAKLQAQILETNSWSSGIAIQNLKTKLSSNSQYLTTPAGAGQLAVETSLTKMAETLIDSRYSVDVITTSITQENGNWYWNGTFTVENESAPDDDFYPDEEDTPKEMSIVITGDYEVYIKQCIDITLSKLDTEDYSVTGLFKLEYDDFVPELAKYAIVPLESFQSACQSMLDILIEQGCSSCDANGKGTIFDGKDLYNLLYVPYIRKYDAIETELNKRNEEYTNLEKLEEQIIAIQNEIHGILDFEKYIKTGENGKLTDEKLWREFCAFRREDTYSNSNYISDGLSNAEILQLAKEFVETAKKEIVKSATLQHSITSTVKNLITIKEFEPLLKHFDVGNWLRIEVDDDIHKLRLLSYSISWDDYSTISVTFSDVMKVGDDITDWQSVKKNVNAMSSSYSYTQRQAEKGNETNKTISSWVNDGLTATTMKIVNNADNQTVTYDEHGILIRQYNPVTENYDPCQTKFIHSTMSITNDNWKSTKTAVGRFYYIDPVNGELTEAYGINAETVIGKLILGSNLGLYNEGNSLTFDANGLNITNGVNTFSVDPNASSLFTITNDSTKKTILSLNTEGNLSITGSGNFSGTITAGAGSKIGPWNITDTAIYMGSASLGTINSAKDNLYFGTSGLSLGGKLIYNISNNSLYLSGKIETTSGKIGGFTIDSNYLANNTTGLGTTANSVYLGTSGISCGTAFKVTNAGKLNASGAIINGEITATSITAKSIYRIHVNGIEDSKVIVATDKWDIGNMFSLQMGLLQGNSYFAFEYRDSTTDGNNIAAVCSAFSVSGQLLVNGAISTFINDVDIWGTLTAGGFTFSGASISNNTGCVINNGTCACGLYGTEKQFRMAAAHDGTMNLGSGAHRWLKVYASSTSISTSDERDKNIIGEFDERHKKLFMKLKPILFKWKDENIDTDIHFGLGAQTTEQFALECGIAPDEIAAIEHTVWDEPSPRDGRTDRYGMGYDEIHMLTIPVVQEHEKRIELLEEKIKQLEQENKLLQEAM